MTLHPIQNPHHTHRSLTPRSFQHQPKRPRILRIDLPPYQPLRLQRREAVAHIAATRLKRLRQLRRLNPALLLKKNCSQHQRLEKSNSLVPKNEVQRRLHLSRNPCDLHNWTLAQKSFNPHLDSLHISLRKSVQMIDILNYL